MPNPDGDGRHRPRGAGHHADARAHLCDLWEWGGGYEYNGILDDEELQTEELVRYREAGGTALVDVTTIGAGRNPAGMRRLAEATGLHLIMGAGWYRERVYPREVYELNANRLADRIVGEFADGADGMGVRPGIIGELGTERFPHNRRPRNGCFGPARGRNARSARRSRPTRRTSAIWRWSRSRCSGKKGCARIESSSATSGSGATSRLRAGHRQGRRLRPRLTMWVASPGPGRSRSASARGTWWLSREAGHLDQLLISMDICGKPALHWNGGQWIRLSAADVCAAAPGRGPDRGGGADDSWWITRGGCLTF